MTGRPATTDQLPTPRPPEARGGLPRPALAAAAVLALLVVVALASRGSHPLTGGGEESRAPSQAFLDYAFTALVLLMAAVSPLVVAGMVMRGKAGAQAGRSHRSVLSLLVVFAVVGLILVGVRNLRGGDGRPPAPLTPTLPNAGPGGGRDGEAARDRPPQFRWGVAAAAAGIAVAALATAAVARARRRARRRAGGDEELAEELATLLDVTIDDLLAEPDPRRAVIAAYARMERVLAANELPRRHSESPLEFLRRASGMLHERHPAARRLLFELTALFERAKFSDREVDAGMKQDAIASLSGLRDELREAA